jgi:hypothetical protein
MRRLTSRRIKQRRFFHDFLRTSFLNSASHPLVTTSLLGGTVGSRQLENKIRNQRFERIDIETENLEVARSAGAANCITTLLLPALYNAVTSAVAHLSYLGSYPIALRVGLATVVAAFDSTTPKSTRSGGNILAPV